MQRLLFILFFACLKTGGLAQGLAVNDTSDITVRTFSPGEINAYKTDHDFQYERFAEPPKSVWDRFWDWFWQKVGKLLVTGSRSQTFRYLLLTFAIAVLGFFLLKAAGMTNAGLFGKDNKAGLPYSLLNEDIHAIPFDDAIHQAVEERNFRYAVRLLYLQSLKYLADRALINWHTNKTNEAYVHELAGSALQPAFRSLTLQFENNWYGNMPIAESEFGKVRNQFNQFNQQFI